MFPERTEIKSQPIKPPIHGKPYSRLTTLHDALSAG